MKNELELSPVRRDGYRAEYCEMVKDFCAHGLSLTAFAGSIDTSRTMINEWAERYPEFDEACRTAMAKRSHALEEGLLSVEASSPMVTARRFALSNGRFKNEPTEWSERANVEVTGKDGAALEAPVINIKSLSVETLKTLEQALTMIEQDADPKQIGNDRME